MNTNEQGFISVDVVKKKDKWGFTRISGASIAAIFGILGGVPFVILTILGGPIGALIGLILLFPLLALAGLGLFASLGTQKVECPACEKESTIYQRHDAFDCPRCKTRVVVNWR